MIFPRTFFPLHRCYLANSTTMLFIFICFTQKVVKWVVELMLHRGGADGVGRAFSSELFPSFLYEKRVFFASAFSIANNCENFQFPAAHSELHGCALYCTPAGFNSDFMVHFFHIVGFQHHRRELIIQMDAPAFDRLLSSIMYTFPLCCQTHR